MEQITLGDFAAFLAFLAGLGGSIATIVHFVKKALSGLFKEQMGEIMAQIQSVDLENCKNYLVTFLSKVERGEPFDEIEYERFHEQYEHYQKIGGNSYIRAKVEKLKAEGKL